MPRATPAAIAAWHPHATPDVMVSRVEGDTRLWAGHSTAYVVTVTYAGGFDFWYRGRVRTQVAGPRLKLKEPGEVHRDERVHAPVTAQSLAFAPTRVAAAAVDLGLSPRPHLREALSHGQGQTETAALALHAALATGEPEPLELETRICEVLDALLTEYGESPAPHATPRHAPAVLRARDYLHANPARNVSLDALSREVGLNKFHLLRVFRAQLGLPPHEYVTHLRVARARALLSQGMAVADVATEVGVYDQSQLNRHFRRIVGMTPGQFARAVGARQ
ncbi:AraC family transcriptional regulator [Myxococcus sp. K15C18031901]|uniref:helix-turn-helix domain-containing protein n=1 Tax=Myxococcus dinghuensis TaxID=2906761 RepID=UPI0020A809C9|nr:AraC family transcriptional regulator [Myxococcus dinghuensis]MCP3104297.1 AraC family transcriptional regulator [Myxococcus dinghuensis]